jgi:hypothetical protein
MNCSPVIIRSTPGLAEVFNPGLRFDIDRSDSYLRFRSNICRGATQSAAQSCCVSAALCLSATAVLLPELRLQLSRLFDPDLFVPFAALFR